MGYILGKLNLSLKDDVETKFREEVFKRKGMKKGNIKEAVEAAMLMWNGTSKKDESEIHKH